jgi:hypothetical protein
MTASCFPVGETQRERDACGAADTMTGGGARVRGPLILPLARSLYPG